MSNYYANEQVEVQGGNGGYIWSHRAGAIGGR